MHILGFFFLLLQQSAVSSLRRATGGSWARTGPWTRWATGPRARWTARATRTCWPTGAERPRWSLAEARRCSRGGGGWSARPTSRLRERTGGEALLGRYACCKLESLSLNLAQGLSNAGRAPMAESARTPRFRIGTPHLAACGDRSRACRRNPVLASVQIQKARHE